jgi:hypothetical protein
MIRNPKAFEAWSIYSCWVHSVITELEMLSLPKETTLIHFTKKTRRSAENNNPPDQQNQHIESQPQDSGSS